jgi:alkanesulfonate monooxygenase SsuD/methylene tetrahydromethanopterin reductase-like flavin-dependent oxidoreductase (luciferase family)
MSQLRVGFMAGGGDRREVERLEALPIDSLWTGGHIASRNPGPDAMSSLIRLATLTERVRVGTSILLLPLYPPAIVAKMVGEADRMTGGRVTLGVGIGGEYVQEFSACQVPVSERGKRTDEAIPLIRSLWSGTEVTSAGRFYPMENVKLHPPPVQPGGPPIAVAGRKPPAMRRAALLGDGWMPYLYSPERYASSVQTITALADEAGRSLEGFEWFAFLFVNVNPDGETAREEGTAFLGGNYNQDFREMLDRVAVTGTPAEVSTRLQAFLDAGARHLVFTPATRADSEPIRRRLLEEVLPGLSVPGMASPPR